MLDLGNHIVLADGPSDDTVLAMPRAIAKAVFHEAFAQSSEAKLTYADFVAKQRALERMRHTSDRGDAQTIDDLLAWMTAETRVIKKSALKIFSGP